MGTVTRLPNLAPLRVIDPIGWQGKDLPERKWMVQGLIPVGAVTMLGGDGGLGKSLLALQLMTAAATGQRWLNMPTMKCKTLGVFCEDDPEELHIRVAGICEAIDVPLGDLDDMRLISRVGEDNLLQNVDKFGKSVGESNFYRQLVECIRDFGAQLIVMDSLHDLFGGNENVRTEARQFISMLRRIATMQNGAVVLCSHPSAAGLSSGSGVSGSTAWNNAVRSRLYLSRPNSDDPDADPDKRILSTKKSNYGQALGNIELKYAAGVFVRTDDESYTSAALRQMKAEETFMRCLDICAKAGRPVTDAPNTARYAPKVFGLMPEARGVSLGQLAKAMAALFSAEKISLDVVGKHANRTPMMGIVRTKPPAQSAQSESVSP